MEEDVDLLINSLNPEDLDVDEIDMFLEEKGISISLRNPEFMGKMSHMNRVFLRKKSK